MSYIFVQNDRPMENITVGRNNAGDFLFLFCDSDEGFRTPITEKELLSLGKALHTVASGKKKKARFKLADDEVLIRFDGRVVLEFSFSFEHPYFCREADVSVEYFGFSCEELCTFANRILNYDGRKISIRE